MQNPAYNLRRVASYLLGFLLFYEPFMLFNQLASTFFVDTSFSSIHVPCARIPLASIVTGGSTQAPFRFSSVCCWL